MRHSRVAVLLALMGLSTGCASFADFVKETRDRDAEEHVYGTLRRQDLAAGVPLMAEARYFRSGFESGPNALRQKAIFRGVVDGRACVELHVPDAHLSKRAGEQEDSKLQYDIVTLNGLFLKPYDEFPTESEWPAPNWRFETSNEGIHRGPELASIDRERTMLNSDMDLVLVTLCGPMPAIAPSNTLLLFGWPMFAGNYVVGWRIE